MDDTAKIWRLLSDGTVQQSDVLTLTEHNDWKRFVPFVPTGSVFSIMGPWIRSVAFDPTGRFLATSRDDSTVRLWRVLPDGNVHPSPIGILEGHRHEVTSVAFHPSGQFLATGSGDYTVKLWRFPPDRLNPECIETLTGHTSPITSVAFHSNGELLATGSYDNTAKLWDCSKINELLKKEALTHGSISAKVIKEFTTGNGVGLGSESQLRFSNAAQGRIGNTPDTQENKRKQAEITGEKYVGLLHEPLSLTQCDRCRTVDVEAAVRAAADPQCIDCPGVAKVVNTDKMPGGRMSRKKVNKRLSRK
jgi:WD40 repeat protein